MKKRSMLALFAASIFTLGINNTSIAEETSPADNSESTDNVVPAYSESNWCQQREQFEYGYQGDDFVGFQLKKGTLTGNMERLVAEFYPNSNGFISKVGRHLVAGDYCIVAPNKESLIQAIIEPYYVGNIPIYFGTFTNEFYALFYKDDPEFVRYRLGVRK